MSPRNGDPLPTAIRLAGDQSQNALRLGRSAHAAFFLHASPARRSVRGDPFLPTHFHKLTLIRPAGLSLLWEAESFWALGHFIPQRSSDGGRFRCFRSPDIVRRECGNLEHYAGFVVALQSLFSIFPHGSVIPC